MRKLGFSVLVLVMLGAAIGCDSGGDEESGPTDAEVFVGSWRLATLFLNGADFTDIVLASATVTIDFEASTFNITIMTDSMSTIAGSYTVNDVLRRVTLTSSDFTNPVPLDYTINSENQITMETRDAALFIGLTGIDPATLGGLVIEEVGLVVQRTAITTF